MFLFGVALRQAMDRGQRLQAEVEKLTVTVATLSAQLLTAAMSGGELLEARAKLAQQEADLRMLRLERKHFLEKLAATQHARELNARERDLAESRNSMVLAERAAMLEEAVANTKAEGRAALEKAVAAAQDRASFNLSRARFEAQEYKAQRDDLKATVHQQGAANLRLAQNLAAATQDRAEIIAKLAGGK